MTNRSDVNANFCEDKEPEKNVSGFDVETPWMCWATRELDRRAAALFEASRTLTEKSARISQLEKAVEGFEAWMRHRDPVLKIFPPGKTVTLIHGIDVTVLRVYINEKMVVRYECFAYEGYAYRNYNVGADEIKQAADLLLPSQSMIEIDE